MKNKIKILILSIFLISLCSCRSMFVKTTVWVMDCINGSLTVVESDEDDGYKFIITANPDDGYCLKKENLIVRALSGSEISTLLGTTEIEENKYGMYVSGAEKIVVSAVFTKVEE